MAEIILAIIFGLVGLAALGFTVLALPWASEPNAPKGMVAWPLGTAVVCLGLSALFIFGG